jgi:hypothetical protein
MASSSECFAPVDHTFDKEGLVNQQKKPLIFVGSSREALGVARTIGELLCDDARIELWTSNTFKPSMYPLDALFDVVERCDYAVFVLAPDDIAISRNQQMAAPRDNVIFEAGFFIGRLGKQRTFLIYDEENEAKLPSDLKGLTLLSYSHKRYDENRKAALDPPANQIRSALKNEPQFEEMDLLKAYISFIHPQTSFADSYANILARKMQDIRRELVRLESSGESMGDWYTLIEVKKRLREYFEYSGRYLEGAEIGRLFARALQKSGEDHEAAWTRVKQIGYLLILAGEHNAGRKEISQVLAALQSGDLTDATNNVLRFYCNRYLGISFQRDDVTGSLERAQRYFDEAMKCIDAMSESSTERREMHARLLGNRGNLALQRREPGHAIEFYKASHKIFLELDDMEHIGIAKLQIAQTIIAGAGNPEAAGTYLDGAENIFIKLGWVEGQGRVYEQFSMMNELLARRASEESVKFHHLCLAMEHAKRARALFVQIDTQKKLGAIEVLIERLQAGTSTDQATPCDVVR